jgi:hypothetical protein
MGMQYAINLLFRSVNSATQILSIVLYCIEFISPKINFILQTIFFIFEKNKYMYYIKCNQCGHENELQSEFQTFCSSCNKPLDNSFAEWKKNNQEKTFDDYKKAVCISSETNESFQKLIEKNNSYKKWVWLIVIAAIIGLAIRIGFAYFYIKMQKGMIMKQRHRQEEMMNTMNENWQKKEYGNNGLMVETPFDMPETKLSLPQDVVDVIAQMNTYTHEADNGFSLVVSSIEFKPVVKEFNIENSANGSLNEIKNKIGVTNFNYTQSFEIKKDSFQKFTQQGNYDLNGVNQNFQNIGINKGQVLYQVFVSYPSNNIHDASNADRIMGSVEIR